MTRQRGRVDGPARALLQHRAFDGDEARAKAVEAGIVLVARALLDGALASPIGVQRHDGQAVALHAAVAAALADLRVDEDARRRVDELALLAPTPLLGGTGLVVDEQRHARLLAQAALHSVHLGAVMEARAGRKVAVVRVVFVDVVGDDGDLCRAFGLHLARDLGHRELAVDGLAAGHRHSVVVEHLVGHSRARRDGLADGQQAAVEVGAVTEVLEDMRLVTEARRGHPVHALGAHLDQARRAALHPARHEVAADAGQCARALGYLGAAAVRTAAAEVGLALDLISNVSQQRRHGEVDDAAASVQRRIQPRQPVGQHRHDA